ncbi:MAG: 50S ribosomal protein L32 [Candidatus Nomurabacteria bacterium]|nr:50S ribosomal protein L32 [Candidatus Nomurabacteria bacterium]
MSNTMRANKSRRNNRRSHHALTAQTMSTDEKGNVHMRHRASLDSGTYRGKSIIKKA